MKIVSKAVLAASLMLLTAQFVPITARAGSYAFETLATFDDGSDGGITAGVTLGPDGTVYGALSGPHISQGSIFQFNTGTGGIGTVANLGGFSYGGVTMDAQGNIYGTTAYGGSNGYGTVYRMDSQTGARTVLVNFDGSMGNSLAGVTLDAQGNIYGTTDDYSNGLGHVFKIDVQTGVLSKLASFSRSGFNFNSGVTLDAVGNIYGTTTGGGANNLGSVYKIDAQTAQLTTIHSMTDANIWAYGGVTSDAQGNLYGATSWTVYRIDSAGNFSTLADLGSGGRTYSGVTLDAQGNLYFANAGQGYGGDFGTVRRIDAQTGALETLFSFDGANGRNPIGHLAIDGQGNIYGTTQGIYSVGWTSHSSVFRLTNTSSAVPEPTAMAMLAVGAVAVGAVAARGRSRG